jgi:hypothetical protein
MSRARSDPRPTPDGITPLVGYRCWELLVAPELWTLRSLNGEIVHEVNVHQPLGQRNDAWLIARCLENDHDAPEESCACGFYAVKSFSKLLSRTTPSYATTDPGAVTHRVAGRVHLAGKIVEHELGYRAERMRIAELCPFRGTEQIVAQLAHCLGVPAGEPIDPPDPFGAQLTARETEVLRLFAEGRSLEGMAERLQFSSATVRSVTSYILEKLRQHDSTA